MKSSGSGALSPTYSVTQRHASIGITSRPTFDPALVAEGAGLGSSRSGIQRRREHIMLEQAYDMRHVSASTAIPLGG